MIGLKHCEDLLQKIPRAEVARISETVVRTVRDLFPGAWAETVGSYRRGKDFSGDMDILITHENEDLTDPVAGARPHSPAPPRKAGWKRACPPRVAPMLINLVSTLTASGFITDTLTGGHEKTGKGPHYHASWAGVVRLPEPGALHRRMDLKARRPFGPSAGRSAAVG